MWLRKNGLCKILLLILFMAFISSGCGGGSSGNSQGNNGNSNGNNGGQSAEINGTWEIVSGRGVTSTDVNGRIDVSHVTYAQGKNSEVYIEMSKSDSYFGDYFSTTLRGENVSAGGIKGNGLLTVFCTLGDYNNDEAFMLIPGGFAYEYIGNGTYRMTNETYDKAVENMQNNSGRVRTNAGEYENIMTLKDDSTLSWTYWYKNTIGSFTTEYQYEIVLKRAGSSYNPDDYTNNTAPNTNTNNNTNTNTSPTPNTNTNTNTQPDIPPQISGSWKIASGSGLTSQTVSGKVYASHLTYSPQRNDKAFDIDITQNDSTTYYGEHAGLFSLTLTGDNIISSGVKGFGALRVYYSVAEAQGKETSFTFTGGKSFTYIGSGAYRLSFNNGTSYHEQTITLENESTIRWKYTVPSDGWYEIVLTKE